MNMKKYFAAFVAAASLFAVNPAVYAAPEETAPAAEQAAAENGARQVSPEEALKLYKESGYEHVSDRYGYKIILPEKPKSVLPLSVVVDGAKGEIFIFDNDGYTLKHTWSVMLNAFDEASIPVDLNKKTEAEQEKYLETIHNSMPCDLVRVTDVNGVAGVYVITAKEYELDVKGNGKFETVKEDSQAVRTFFRGKLGGRFLVEVQQNPEITFEGEAMYQLGLLTFEEVPAIKMQPAAKK